MRRSQQPRRRDDDGDSYSGDDLAGGGGDGRGGGGWGGSGIGGRGPPHGDDCRVLGGSSGLLSAALDGLTVGSLPSHLLRSHRGGGGVGGGGHAAMARTRRRANDVVGGDGRRGYDDAHDDIRDDDRRFAIFPGPSSLPVPRAPFLSSRRWDVDADRRLSDMPEVRLPESALTAISHGGPSLHCGSLRESRYHHGGDGTMGGAGMGGGPSSSWTTSSTFRHPAANDDDLDCAADAFVVVNSGEDVTTRGTGIVTALDVLTRTSGSSSRGPTAYNDNDGTAVEDGPSTIAPRSKPPRTDDRAPSFDDNYYDKRHHANPDTFEAFDLELE
jgi:hypothetical protein